MEKQERRHCREKKQDQVNGHISSPFSESMHTPSRAVLLILKADWPKILAILDHASNCFAHAIRPGRPFVGVCVARRQVIAVYRGRAPPPRPGGRRLLRAGPAGGEHRSQRGAAGVGESPGPEEERSPGPGPSKTLDRDRLAVEAGERIAAEDLV